MTRLARALCALLLVLCAAPTRAQSPAPLSVGYIPVGDCLQFYVAEAEGFFAAEGLAVTGLAM
jgi:NitT/TauT family transport system substrate-binding protein